MNVSLREILRTHFSGRGGGSGEGHCWLFWLSRFSKHFLHIFVQLFSLLPCRYLSSNQLQNFSFTIQISIQLSIALFYLITLALLVTRCLECINHKINPFATCESNLAKNDENQQKANISGRWMAHLHISFVLVQASPCKKYFFGSPNLPTITGMIWCMNEMKMFYCAKQQTLRRANHIRSAFKCYSVRIGNESENLSWPLCGSRWESDFMMNKPECVIEFIGLVFSMRKSVMSFNRPDPRAL